jgi:Starvation-inducible outer membrane lipoprotein
VLAVMLFLSACASNVPVEIQQDVTGGSASINAVRTDFSRYEGQKIRWGGTIASVENKASDTWIELVGKELGSYGRPRRVDQSLGRFMVRIEGFLDPAIYKPDRELTVYGTVESRMVRQIDEHPYTYPLIRAQTYYLWDDYDRYYNRYAYYPYGYYPYHYYYGLHYGHYHGGHLGYHFGMFHHF